MADIQDVRAQMREMRHQPTTSESGGNLTFYLVAGFAVAVGFGIVLFMPKIFSIQRTASLPVFHETISRQAAVAVKSTVAAPAAAQPDPSGYAGKSADEVATIADAVCARGAPARPNGATAQQNASFSADTMPHESERLRCFLSEGPARFCAAGQSRKATADVINYFKGIEYANAKLTGTPARVFGVELAPPDTELAPDPRVIEVVEGLMKAGYLSRAEREEIGASVPPDVKHRFAVVIANASPCPKPPWWAVWK
jgi:hypothetical protein